MSPSRSSEADGGDAAGEAPTGFALQLRYWRRLRGHSQLQLALEAGISSRHLSFLETGRSQASDATLTRLAAALRLSPADTTCLRRGRAGLDGRPPSPEPRARAGLRRAVDAHTPFPAMLVDSIGTIQHTNRAMDRLIDHVRGDRSTPNVLDLYVAPWGFRAIVEDEARLAPIIFAQIRRDLLAAQCPEAMKVLRRISRLAPDLARRDPDSIPHDASPVLETVVKLGDRRLRLSWMHASPGSEDAGSRTDWRIETILPLDDETAAFFTS